ncbi:Scaffold protein Nfu/NifU N terminal [Seinonella peptonophila]|uniref:Scaffold protein Nfu/NifU N terminal n=1 Tax=Seinonella peptonophila TaxID=112248 RepID=A0A1M4TNV5_9BACL|nr:conserved virulence factor C family protein [Seinonella peptonophila]SHE45977.1 Scaffold protein Nfu/NifU N terminal [Seinonella peptonophila]
MKILSIEPTPSPNAMKLNLDQSLPEGKNLQFQKQEKDGAPDYLRRLLEIDGVTGVFQVLDFISLERHPKADWQQILSAARNALGDVEHRSTETDAKETEIDPSYLEITVEVQQLKGIPLQVKLRRSDEERRFGLSNRFTEAVLEVQKNVSNHIFERKWVVQRPRYGDLEQVGEQVVAELEATYNDTRLQQLIIRSAQQNVEPEPKMTLDQIKAAMDAPDWETRYRALDQLEPEPASMPVLERALKDQKMSIRRQAVVILGYFEDEIALPLLCQALTDSSPMVRRTAGDCLSDLGSPKAVPAMSDALSDRNKLVRWRAARFLFEVGDERAIPALQKALEDPEFEVRMQTQIALERIEKGEAASGTVWQQMTRSRQQANPEQ